MLEDIDIHLNTYFDLNVLYVYV